MIEHIYFTYGAPFSSWNMSLMMWVSIFPLLPPLQKDKTVMKLMEQSSGLNSLHFIFTNPFLYFTSFFPTVPVSLPSLSPSFSSLPLTFSMFIFTVPRKSPHLHSCLLLAYQSTPFFNTLFLCVLQKLPLNTFCNSLSVVRTICNKLEEKYWSLYCIKFK